MHNIHQMRWFLELNASIPAQPRVVFDSAATFQSSGLKTDDIVTIGANVYRVQRILDETHFEHKISEYSLIVILNEIHET